MPLLAITSRTSPSFRSAVQSPVRFSLRAPFAATALAAALALGCGVTLLSHGPAAAQSAPQRGMPDFTELVDQVGPSVVNIRTTEKVAPRGVGNGAPNEEDMQEFFRRFFGDRMPMPQPNPRATPRPNTPTPSPEPDERSRPRGVGSGFVLSADGYVMTNAHVVKDASEVIVTLPDKREFKAKVVGADERTDVAVLKIEASGLPAVKIGNSDKVKVGEWVLAIGSPFGLDSSVTAGIVSAKARETGDLLPFIQTDVAINPGNSGGPLINMRGEVIGVNSQIFTRSGGSMGISFSIPIDAAQRVSEQLRATGKVQRGMLGVFPQDVSKELAESIGQAKPSGALVARVTADSPAEKAGLEAGDIVTKIDGKIIEKAIDLRRVISSTKPGAVTTITVLRRGATKEFKVTVAELTGDTPPVARPPAPAASKPAASAASDASKALGLALSDLTDKQKTDLKIKRGVRIESAEGRAARAGLRSDDVILSVGNAEVGSVKEFEAALDKMDKAKPVNVLFRRGEWAQYAVISAPPVTK